MSATGFGGAARAMRRLEIQNVSALRNSVRRELPGSPRARYLHRLHCLLCVAAGHSCYEVAEWFGESPRNIERWVHRWSDHGAEGLRELPRPGRRSRLGPKAVAVVRRDLAGDPRVHGTGGAAWTGATLSAHLCTHFGIRLSERQCQRLLRRLR